VIDETPESAAQRALALEYAQRSLELKNKRKKILKRKTSSFENIKTMVSHLPVAINITAGDNEADSIKHNPIYNPHGDSFSFEESDLPDYF
jgi:hypothetical protein